MRKVSLIRLDPTVLAYATAGLSAAAVSALVLAFALGWAGDPLRWPLAMVVTLMGVAAINLAFQWRRLAARLRSAIDRIGVSPVLTDTHFATPLLADRNGSDDPAVIFEALCDQLSRERESLLLATSGADDGLFDIDLKSGKAMFSARAREILSLPDRRDIMALRTLLRVVDPGERRRFITDLRRFLAPGGGVLQRELPLLTGGDGSDDGPGSDPRRWLRIRAAAFRDTDGRARRVAGAIQDITTQKLAEELRVKAAYIDPVTGLPNRVKFLNDLDAMVHRLADAGSGCVLLAVVDVDRFRRVNDALGRDAGDALLQEMGRRLGDAASVRHGIAGRLGGDQFAFARYRPEKHRSGRSNDSGNLSNIDEEARVLGSSLARAFDVPFTIKGVTVHPSISVGVVAAQPGRKRPDDILGEASQALANAKKEGRGHIVVGERRKAPAFMTDGAMLVLEDDLRQAITANALDVLYQPIVESASGRLAGVEALVRWHHPEHGDLSPEIFVPLAEETSLIIDLGNWVLDRALGDFAAWQRRDGGGPAFVAINLSRRQLSAPNLTESVGRAVSRHRLSPGVLKLEVTESLIMDGSEKVAENLQALHLAGVALAIDDFGTGHSSLALLGDLPFNTLKIDRQFMADIRAGKGRAEAVVRGIVSLAHRLDFDVVAEGIETEDEAGLMRRLEVAYCQGYHYGRPLDAQGIAAFGAVMPLGSASGRSTMGQSAAGN